MNFAKFYKTWAATISENATLKNANLLSAVAIVGLIYLLYQRDQVIVLTPPKIVEEIRVSQKKANGGFKRSWALYVAELSGNITAGNADFVVDSLKGMLAPDVNAAFKSALAEQLEVIKSGAIDIRFEPGQVYYEDASDRVFVIGKSQIKGLSGREEKSQRVFEMQVEAKNLLPVITSFDTYDGEPHTQAWLEREARRAERQGNRTKADKADKEAQ